MKNLNFRHVLTALAFAFLIAACGKSTDVVESGTYEGTIDKVEADEREIYVKTDDGKLLELYFIDETVVVSAGDTVDFGALDKAQSVSVKLEKVGKRLDPLVVTIK